MPPPYDLFQHVSNRRPLEAWNVAFERWVWENVCVGRMGWPDVLAGQWRCAMAKARAHSLPGALGKASEVLALAVQKDKGGAYPPVIVLVVLRAQAGRAVAAAAMRERNRVHAVDETAAVGQQRGHLTVAGVVRLAVERPADEEQWPGFAPALPAGPRAASVAEAGFEAEAAQHGVIENQGPVQVGDADEDVRKIAGLSGDLGVAHDMQNPARPNYRSAM